MVYSVFVIGVPQLNEIFTILVWLMCEEMFICIHYYDIHISPALFST